MMTDMFLPSVRRVCLVWFACAAAFVVQAAIGSRAVAAEPPASAAVPQQAGQAPLPGQLSTKFPINYWDPESSVPTNLERDKSPLEFGYFLQDLLERADRARKENDSKAVIRFYRAVAKAVPDNAKGWSKLCEAYELANDRERAMRACRYALDRPAVELQDYVRYVHLVLAREGDLSAVESKDLGAVLAHLESQGGVEFPVNQLRCEWGVKAKDVAMLTACTKALQRLAPDDPRTVVFQWTLAMEKGQRAEAQRLIERATKAGVVLEHIERMQRVTSALGTGFGGRAVRVIVLVGVLLLIVAGLILALRRRSMTQRLAPR